MRRWPDTTERDKLIVEMRLQHYTLKQINRRLVDEGYRAVTHMIVRYAVHRYKARQPVVKKDDDAG